MADFSSSVKVSMARFHSYAFISIMSVLESRGESDCIGCGVNALDSCSFILRVIAERRSEGKSVSNCPTSALVHNDGVGLSDNGFGESGNGCFRRVGDEVQETSNHKQLVSSQRWVDDKGSILFGSVDHDIELMLERIAGRTC